MAFITQYNPYYNYNETKYSNKVDTEIFDSFNLSNIDDIFIENFRKMDFELVFKENIHKYISKITSKIQKISNFENIIKLINFNQIKNKNIILDSLVKRYDSILGKGIEKLTGKELEEAVKVLAHISFIDFIYKGKEKQFDFINDRIKELSEKIQPLIFIEIIKICINEEDRKDYLIEEEIEKKNKMKEFIFEQFSKKVEKDEDIENIIKFLDCLKGKLKKEKENNENNENNENFEDVNKIKKEREKIINEFLQKLMEKNLFSKEEFFSNKKNFKIRLLYELFKKEIIKESDEEYYEKIQNLLKNIKKDLDGNIKKKKLEEFLKNDESFIKQRLSLIQLILKGFDPEEIFHKLKKNYVEINKDIEELSFITENIKKYFKERYKDIIRQLIVVINENENMKIQQYIVGGKIGELIKECNENHLKEKAEKIEKVRDFLLFNVIYEMNSGKDDEINFNDAYKKYENIGKFLKEKKDVNKFYEDNKEIIDKIRETLSNDEKEAETIIEKLKKLYGIENDENLIDELTILFKSKKYDLEINSIIFFFEYFQKDNSDWNKKLSKEYKNLSEKSFQEIKNILKKLKENEIYDYKGKNNYYNKIFTCLYNKKEAIDFIFEKIEQNININYLEEKIQPTNRTISIEDVFATEKCILHMTKMKEQEDNFKILSYIKGLDQKTIKQFEKYSKIFQYIIQLDRIDDASDNIYEQVNKIIKNDLTLKIEQDSEEFFYTCKDQNDPENISMEELIHLKNKIHIGNTKEGEDEKDETDIIKSKRKTLIFFKKLITNLEIINKYMKVLRIKGSTLPIKIVIKVKMLNIKYFLEGKEVQFDQIKTFLLKVKNKHISQLDSVYKEKMNIRFLYGKQFRSLMKHLEKTFNLDSFLRYILNITDNNKSIKEGEKTTIKNVTDYITQFALYNQNSFDSISMYIRSLFEKNNIKTIEDHYNNMIITPKEKYKGIYLHECKSNTQEKFIIDLFWDKLTELPIAQNLLITNKETSSEEIQSFFHRAILCNYNTLFVVEINDSFSEYQQSIMNSYIDQLLSYKNEKYNEETKKNVGKKETQNYLDSCIVFIFDDENKKINSFLKEINKLDEQKLAVEGIQKETYTNKILPKLGNINVITSEICGLGKSEKIRKLIKDSGKKYFHFPLGGILTKNIIYKKLEKLLDKIKNYNYKNVAIHLDLTESKEKSIINEFFFSFLITKFYSNNENIIFIPKDISIYVEIPNCFEDYLSKFSILNIFNKENITIEKIPEFEYSDEIIDIFKRMLEIDSNEKIREFVKEHIGIPKYSFHQINIFIKLFISQYSQFKGKLTFSSNVNGKKEDTTKRNIVEFAKCTRYFTNGGFAKLLTGIDKYNKDKTKDYIDKLSEVYDDDLSCMTFPSPLIFLNPEKMKVHYFKVPEKDSQEYKNSKEFLSRIKEILDIPNEVEKDEKELKSLISILEEENNNYVITNDNFRKIILLVYRIRANVPVIIMGETGCGKTMLITKLNQILNNGKKTVEIIDIHPGINDEKLCKIMKEKDEIAKKQKDEELWLFFDEINTCLSLSLITEIFINRTYEGNKISDNIRLIGACNPYRKRKGNKEKCGLSLSQDNDDELVYLVQPLPQSLLYYVFSFGSIDEIDEKKYIHSIIKKLFTEEEKDLHEITTEAISKCHIYLRNTFDSSVVSLREIARFTKCVEFFKKYFTLKNKYENENNNEKNNKIRSIICSIYLCYYIRLIDDLKRSNFEINLRATLLKLVNSKDEISKFEELNKIIRINEGDKEELEKITDSEKKIIDEILSIDLTEEEKKLTKLEKDLKDEEKSIVRIIELNKDEEEIATQELKKDGKNLTDKEKEKVKDNKLRYFKELKIKYKKYYENTEEKGGNLVKNFKNKELKNEILSRPKESINFFSDFIKIEQDYLIDQIELEKGIGKNTLLKENVFLLFISLLTNIPLIIIGKPGCGKSLSAQLISKSMKGKYSNKEFFQLFPRIIQTYFQGSQSTQPEDVESLFERAGKKLEYYKKKKEKENDLELPISMVLFDELGLAERSESNPLKVLHSRLDYAGKEEGVSFVGISNYTLDAAKVNRALVLSVPDLDQKLDEIIETSVNIVESISPNIKNDEIFKILSNTYFQYKIQLQMIKELVVFKKYVKQYVPPKKEIDNDNISSIEKKEPNTLQLVNQNDKQNSSLTEIEKKSVTTESNLQQNDNNNDETIKKEKWDQIKKKQFGDIKKEKLFKELMKKENKVRIDFHGNRDFYHLIKGTANDLGKSSESSDEEKVRIIVKYIERNFGGIDYEIDIDFNLVLGDIDKEVKSIYKILQGYTSYKENTITKLKSVYLFKTLYNLQFDEKESNQKLKIDPDNINDYNLNNCINENIWDNNSRYLLLEIKQSLTTLIYQNINLQNYLKEILLYDGSPFVDDNNKIYRFMKLNQIQEDAKKDKLIIIENLNQIHPFLFDLYNRNFQIINGKKFARISLDNFDEQLTEVNDGFRIIILVDKRFVNKCDLAFLNRLEKMILSFDELLDNNLKAISRKFISDINIKNTIKKYDNINYSINELLINCGDEEIQGLIYYFSKEAKKDENESDDEDTKKEIDEEQLRERVIDKIYKILPQDIVVILSKKNILRKKYIEKKNIYNFNDYIKEEYKKYKISIIYTFTNTVDGLTSGMSFLISEIRSENELKNLIDEIKDKYKNKEKKYICIHFEQSNSKNIKFISNFILTNFEKDDFNYIFIIHINRNFNKAIKERIYSLPDIKPKINQIFIDNLNSDDEIKLIDILENDIQKIFQNYKDKLKLDEEFNKTLTNFLKKELNEKKHLNFENDTEYINESQNYMIEEKNIKEKIIEITYKIIDNDDENENCEDIIDKIYNEKLINKYTLDIISCLIEYIKEKIFNKNLKNVFKILEDNNILTTLLEVKRRNYESIDKNIVEDIIMNYLDEIVFDQNYKYNCKFLFNYNVPGLYNFFVNISNYINKNITSNYFNNEKELRQLLTNDPSKKTKFQNTEESLLDKVYEEMEKNYKSICKIMDIINDDKDDLIFKDYITYYLQKYRNNYDIYNKDDIYHKIIVQLLKLRFNEENLIITSKDNKNILLIRIIWLESNVNYILNILNIIDNAKTIFNNDKLLFKKIEEEIYQEDKIIIKYITNEKRNPEITKEVNQCYYILLAGICNCITSDEIHLIEYTDNNNYSDEIQIEINYYCEKLKEINKILQALSDDLYIFLNEMYIIDELIKVIEIFKKKINIEKIQNIKKEIRENANIIQKYYNIKDQFKFSDVLINNFEKIYELITKNEEIYKEDKDYYNNLRYILLSEIKKISDIDYRFNILEKLLEENEMIKKSNDIFQILLKSYLKKNDKFKDNRKNILEGNDIIIKLIEDKLDNKIVLEETLLYLFEKNSLIYYNYILKNKKNLDDEPLKIFQECIEYLNLYIDNSKKIEAKLKELCKLFCLGYIKSFCFTFTKMFNDKEPKWKDSKNIINVCNGENSLCKMIRLYIYKILYNNYTINFFYNEDKIKNFKLNEYKDFKEFIKNKDLNNIYKIDFKVKTLKDEYYEESCQVIEKNKKEKFKNKIDKRKFDIEQYGIDNFYIASYNSTLSYLRIKNLDINPNFYSNICQPLFQGKKLLLKALEIFYEPKKYNEIKKKYNIDSNNIKPFLFGYRFCLNELSSEKTNGIYYSLYDTNKLSNLKDKFYPGNDTKLNEVYTDIINHFKYKPQEGCYVCLCKDWYYHSVPSGFPGNKELKMTCPKCSKNIGSFKDEKDIKIVKRDNYYRILKDNDEVKELKKNSNTKNQMKEVNHITLDEFKENYITKSFKNEKGVYITNQNNFKNNKKIVRNLSQISYRLLNYILYTHLFFARIITNNDTFDKYIPKGMTWEKTLSECWDILKNELLKIKIFSIEEFLFYIFTELFPILNEQKIIDKYNDLINLEDKLESKIQELIKKFNEDNHKFSPNNLENDEDKTSTINLLKEKYISDYYDKKDFPFYKYFYYTDYLNEKYIIEKLKHMDDSQYPILKIYLDYKYNDKQNKNKNILDNLYLFNNTLNLISKKYFNNISREMAEKKKLKDEEIYKSNKELFDNFIKFYNTLEIKEIKNKFKLSCDNSIKDFFIDDNNKFGITFKIIYKTFIKQQNEKLNSLLDTKIDRGIFDRNCKNRINIQQINEKEIFTLNLPKKVAFIDILFNSSYRKILDKLPISYKSYKEYVINYDLMEEIMTDLLLKNKKLLNEDITEFIYNNEVFNNQVNDLITSFKKNYTCKELILNDKVPIYKFCDENNDSIDLYKTIIKDFIELIKFLNNLKKESNNDKDMIKEETKIYEILDELKDSISNNFKELFKNNDMFTIDKTTEIFDYFLKSIYEYVSSEIKEYQEELDENSKDKIDNYFKGKHLINKKDFAYAIRIFITLVLFTEVDKEKKIKSNNNNIVNYLKSSDLWKNDINDEKFNQNLNEFKSLNIPINKIIFLYEYLGKDIEENFFDDVKQKINSESITHPAEEPEEQEEHEEQEEQEEHEEEEHRDDDDDDRI